MVQTFTSTGKASIYIYRVELFITWVIITYSKMADQNISHFVIFVSHSITKYINNLKWLTKITNC
jgi:hypothetical protein